MKTVMKKMFSLLLVAALLVSAVPVAFADDTPTTCDEGHAAGEFYEITYRTGDAGNKDATCSETGTAVWRCHTTSAFTGEARGHLFTTTIPVLSHTEATRAAVAATCTSTGLTEGKYCSECGEVITAQTVVPIDATKHAYGDWTTVTAATCSAEGLEARTCAYNAEHRETRVIPIKSDAHKNNEKGVCTICKLCEHCGFTGGHEDDCIALCNGASNCPNTATNTDAHNEGCLKTKCTKTAGCILPEGHTEPCDAPCTFDDCEKVYGHSGDHSNACATCGKALMKSSEHSKNCSWYESTNGSVASGSKTLYVWANIYIGSTYEKTVQLSTKATGVSGDAKIVDVMATLRSDINDEVKNSSKFDDYHGLDWDTQDYYYKVDDGEYKTISSRMTVSDDPHVYINLYSAEKLVVVNVHTRKSYSTDLTVRIRGKRVGDTVTYDDVKDAVKKYYSVNSLSIYEYDEWCDVVEGGSGKKTYDFEVESGDNIYEAYISGSRKSGTYTYTADSSNPKTGDAIFAPIFVLGASASALAVLFYLNKKRAY